MTNYLEDKVIKIKAISNSNGYLFDTTDHDGATLYTGTERRINLPRSQSTGRLVPVFKDKEEQAFFAKELNLKTEELDCYNPNTDFWVKTYCKLTKEGITLNLKDPMDNIYYRILKASAEVAPSWNERFDRRNYKFAIVEDGYEVSEINKKADKTRRAWKAFGKIEDSIDKMSDVLELYGKNVPRGAKLDWLQAELTKMIEDNKPRANGKLSPLDEFLSIIEDKNFETRLLISKAVQIGALVRSGKNGYKLPGVEERENNTADNLTEMIDFLRDLKNQPITLKIKAQIEAAK